MKAFLSVLALSLVACADCGYAPVRVDNDYAKSVKQLSRAQLLHPKTATNPDTPVTNHMDGMVGQSIMTNYRDSFNKAETVQSVTINVGGSGK